jgi:hypothetical protein
VKNNRLVLPNGVSYSVLVLPNTKKMTAGLAMHIIAMVKAGATVIGPKPTTTPSLTEAAQDGNRYLRTIANACWGETSSTSGSQTFGKGRVVWGKTVGNVLTEMHTAPDFLTSSNDVRAIHRRYGSTDAYFVASSSQYPKSVTCKFRIEASKSDVQLWHPETGEIVDAPIWKAIASGIEIPLDFDCTGSVFVVFRPKSIAGKHITSTTSKVAAQSALSLPKLRIVKALYGDAKSGKVADVTRFVVKAVENDAVRISATNGELGGDPAYLVVKSLVVTYEIGGQTKTVVIPENGTLALGNLPQESTPPTHQYGSNKLYAWQNGTFSQTWSDGQKTTFKVSNLTAAKAVSGAWQIRFVSTYDPPKVATYPTLKSWTDDANFDTKHFSGTGTYSKTINIDRAQITNGMHTILDLGDVRELCRIRLNGKAVATLWKSPFRVDITDFAKAGENKLEVDVTNLWTNRLIGDEQFPDDMGWNGNQLSGWPSWFTNHKPRPEPRRKTFTTWRHNFKDTPLLPSGLIGPVVLRPVKVIGLRK